MIALGCDHGGYNLMVAIKQYLEEHGIAYKDFGTDSAESVDYPVYAYRVAKAVTSGECALGILCCGTGIGIAMAANKVKGVRAAVVNDAFGAEMTRRHNHANILCMGERVIGQGLVLELVDIFLTTGFEGGRHQRRVDKITALEQR